MNVGKRILILVLALLLVMPSSYSAVVLEVGSSGENVRKVQQRPVSYTHLCSSLPQCSRYF